jgi:anthranilate synthase component 2
MLTLIDNYDSFTYNLVHFLGELGATCRVYRNDKVTVDEVLAEAPAAIVLSPGPCDPDRAGICLELIERAGKDVPILGVCLGHQSIGQVYGGRVVRAPTLMHGKLSKIQHAGKGVFPVHGVQFHPESIASEHGHQLLANFLDLARVECRARASGSPREAIGAL